MSPEQSKLFNDQCEVALGEIQKLRLMVISNLLWTRHVEDVYDRLRALEVLTREKQT